MDIVDVKTLVFPYSNAMPGGIIVKHVRRSL